MTCLISGKSVLPTGGLTIFIQHYCGPSVLKLDSGQYKNELGQRYTISKFKYYIGNIHLVKSDGTGYTSKKYYLVDEDDASTKKLLVKDIPEGDYNSISFNIGVDSIDNCSGAQSEALDPGNGMFWTWSTGYIFLKLEGHADASLSPGHIFEYHLGGYKQPNNCLRRVSLDFGKQSMKASAGRENHITLAADVAEILKAENKIDFAKLSSVTDFHNSGLIADNYAHMFRIIAP